MYLTAHHIRTEDGLEDVHAFLYRHQGPVPRTMRNRRPDLALISTEQPGTLIRQSVVLPSGGNSVESYLDFAAEDDALMALFEQTFEQILASISDDSSFAHIRDLDIAAEFYVSPRVLRNGQTRESEVRRLWTAARALLAANAGTQPLVARVEPTTEGKVYFIDEGSANRVRRILGADWRRPRVAVTPEVRSEFERLHGSIFPHLATVLTGLKESEIQDLGGIEFLDATTGQRLYPAP